MLDEEIAPARGIPEQSLDILARLGVDLPPFRPAHPSAATTALLFRGWFGCG
jgi:hypothetical protein